MYAYLRNGGNYVGVHAGSACLYGDKQYGKLVGAHFDYHPSLQQAVRLSRLLLGAHAGLVEGRGQKTALMIDHIGQTFTVLDKTHPSTSDLPETWTCLRPPLPCP